MLRAVPLVQEFLIAVEDQDKHLTLDEVNDAALQLEGFHENMVAASGMFVPGGGLSGKPGARRGAGRRSKPVKFLRVAEAAGRGGRSGPPRSDTLVGNPPPMPEQVAPPARPPAKTIEASPPPPPQAARPGGPTPVTDVEVVKANVNSPGSIQPRSPAAHQNDWNASGGRGTAPGAFRDGQGNIHVSSDHPLMGSPGKGGIPPVSPRRSRQSRPPARGAAAGPRARSCAQRAQHRIGRYRSGAGSARRETCGQIPVRKHRPRPRRRRLRRRPLRRAPIRGRPPPSRSGQWLSAVRSIRRSRSARRWWRICAIGRRRPARHRKAGGVT